MTKPAAIKQKPDAPPEPRVVFVVRVFARPAMSRSIESVQIREALEKCCLQFGAGSAASLPAQSTAHTTLIARRGLRGVNLNICPHAHHEKDRTMSTLFTLTVTDQGNYTKAAEVQLVSQALASAAQAVRSTRATSGNIITDKGTNIGSWSYTGTASHEG
jgi:hypothetical protein